MEKKKIKRTSQRNEMEITFDALSENESFARVTAAAFVAPLDPTMEEISDIKTAVSEAVTNSVIHGYDDEFMKSNQIEGPGKIYMQGPPPQGPPRRPGGGAPHRFTPHIDRTQRGNGDDQQAI